jgi:dGTPase
VNVGDERFRREKRKREYRTEFQIDRDRVLYSPHLARLAEVTQVRASGEGFLVHNRLTHSLKVAQLARRIAEKLVKVQEDLSGHLGLDPDAAEAAGLAHDMGHPPFGHIAEKELDSLVRDRGVSDGYEGNAQTFRIVARLSVGDSSSQENDVDVPGLNLTARTINGLLRYPWSFKDSGTQRKWGVYDTENRVFEWAQQIGGLAPKQRSVEAEVMDWADDITYAIHDLVDFYCAGKIPLHLLADSSRGNTLGAREREAFLEGAFRRNPRLAEQQTECRKVLEVAFGITGSISSGYTGVQQQARDLWGFSSELITRYVNAIELVDYESRPDKSCVSIRPMDRLQTDVLKELTWYYVINDSDLKAIQFGQTKMIRELFSVVHEEIEAERLGILPKGFQELIKSGNGAIPSARWAADYISGMTERELTHVHRRLLAPS